MKRYPIVIVIPDADTIDCAWVDSPDPALRARYEAYLRSFEVTPPD